MNAKWIFLGGSGQPRSGWRAALFLALLFVAVMLFGSVLIAVLYSLDASIEPSNPAFLLSYSSMMLVLALAIGWICGKYLERLPFRALGAWFTRGWLRHLIAGALVGIVTVLFAILIAVALGGLRFQFNVIDIPAIFRSLAMSLVVFAVAAAYEEAIFRGYLLQTFARSGLAYLAIAVTAIFFGWAHVGNESASPLSIVNTILAGVWFGIGYMKTRDLWFVWGMHLMWNWMQSAVFGIEVSGITSIVEAPLLREIDSGPAWLTGAAYGVEGGIVTTIAIIGSTAAIYFAPWLRPSEEMRRLTDPVAFDAGRVA